MESSVELPPFHQPVGAERYAESLIHLMDVFGHAVLHVEREIDIAGYLRRVIESELLLHAVSDYYRDHLYHLVDLALLGDFLLTAREGRRRGYMWRLLVPPESVQEGTLTRYRLDLLRKQWFIAAMFHDVGYLFSLIARIPDLLREQGSASHADFVRSVEQALRGEVEALEQKIRQVTSHLAGSGVGLDRGVHSAVILRDHLESAVRPAEWAGGLVGAYLPSLRAICQHSLHTEKVEQDRDPLSFLMVLCDELTDWGRNRVRARELRRFTVFRTVLDANWQERRIPVLTELMVGCAGLEGGAFVIDTPRAELSPGAQPHSRRRDVRLNIVQVYHQDEVGYLNPIYLWVLRAHNLERLVPSCRGQRSRRGDRSLDIRLATVTGVPYRLRKAETLHVTLLEEIAAEEPALRLRDLVHELTSCFIETVDRQRDLDACGAAKPGDPFEAVVDRLRAELGLDGGGAMDRTVELQVFRLATLAEHQPLRGFRVKEQLVGLATAFQLLLAGREEQRRLQGLRGLRSGELSRPKPK